MEEVIRMLGVYGDFAEEVHGDAGHPRARRPTARSSPARSTSYCIEAMMQDGKALQAGTSHDLGQNFGKAFDVKFQNEAGEHVYVWQTSWGVSTRLIGGLIMTHSDDDGLVIPPKLAPLHVAIVPFFRKKEDENARVKEAGHKLAAELNAAGIATKFDDLDGPPGPKFYKYEREGVCLRLGIGPRDLDNNQAELKRRDEKDKASVSLDGIVDECKTRLDQMQKDLFDRAKKFRDDNTCRLDSYDDFRDLMKSETKFVYAHWDGTKETEAKVKQDTGATIRCIPMEGQGFEAEPGECMVTGQPSAQRVIWAKAY